MDERLVSGLLRYLEAEERLEQRLWATGTWWAEGWQAARQAAEGAALTGGLGGPEDFRTAALAVQRLADIVLSVEDAMAVPADASVWVEAIAYVDVLVAQLAEWEAAGGGWDSVDGIVPLSVSLHDYAAAFQPRMQPFAIGIRLAVARWLEQPVTERGVRAPASLW